MINQQCHYSAGTEALGVTPEQIKSKVGSFGVPEFGTKFVRGMLVDTKPTTFDELIRISGLSHGTDVWLNNAADLIKDGTVTLKEAICCRDDIMIYLIKKGLDPNKSFKIMESVRKGKVAGGKEKNWPEYQQMMREHDVPDWYISSCEKIKYMFPKAHAAAYVTNAFRIAWFKVHIPKAYYSAFFSIRAADNFDASCMILGKEKVKNKMKEIDMKANAATKKEQDMYAVLELVLEMYERGIDFLPIDLYKSHYKNFIVEDEGIRPPFASIAGFGPIAAESLYNAAREEEFMSIDEIRIRAKLGDSPIDLLREFGVVDGMQESNQISLFG
jgi:DNA polymerase-3 subunit alpha (Gram-positive type)